MAKGEGGGDQAAGAAEIERPWWLDDEMASLGITVAMVNAFVSTVERHSRAFWVREDGSEVSMPEEGAARLIRDLLKTNVLALGGTDLSEYSAREKLYPFCELCYPLNGGAMQVSRVRPEMSQLADKIESLRRCCSANAEVTGASGTHDLPQAYGSPCIGAIRAGIAAYDAWAASDEEQKKYNAVANLAYNVFIAMAKYKRS